MNLRALMERTGDVLARRWWLIRPTQDELRAFHAARPSVRRIVSGITLVGRDATARIMQKGLPEHSAAITYNLILSVVPLLAIAVSFFNFFGGLQTLLETGLYPKIFALFNEGVAQVMVAYLRGFVANIQTSSLGATGLLTLLLTVTTLLGAIERSFNDIVEAPGERPVYQRLLNYWLLLTLTPFVVVLSVAKSTELLSWLANYLPFPVTPSQGEGTLMLRTVSAFIIESLGFAVLYLVLPLRRVPANYALVGGVFAAVGFESLQRINTYASARLFREASVVSLYGNAPVIAVILFIWLRLVAYVLLLGMIVSVSSARCLSLRSQRTARWRENSGSPVDNLLAPAKVLDALVCGFREAPRGQTATNLAQAARLETARVQESLDWLAAKELAWVSLSTSRDPSGGSRRWHPTHRGLELHGNPLQFVHDVLGLRHQSTSDMDEVDKADADIANNDQDTDFAARVRRLISADTTVSSRPA